MDTNRIVSRPIPRKRLDQAVGSMLASPQTKPADKVHLERLAGPFAANPAIFPSAYPATAGLGSALEDRLMPRLTDPSILENGKMIAILQSIDDRIKNSMDQADAPTKLQSITHSLISREIDRMNALRARMGELLEG